MPACTAVARDGAHLVDGTQPGTQLGGIEGVRQNGFAGYPILSSSCRSRPMSPPTGRFVAVYVLCAGAVGGILQLEAPRPLVERAAREQQPLPALTSIPLLRGQHRIHGSNEVLGIAATVRVQLEEPLSSIRHSRWV